MAYGPYGPDGLDPGIDPLPYPSGPMDTDWGYSDVPGLMPYLPYQEFDRALEPWHAPYPEGYPQWPNPPDAINPQPFPYMPFAPMPHSGAGGVVPGLNLPGEPPPPPRKIDLFKGLFPGFNKSRSQLPMQQMPNPFQGVPYGQQLQGLEGYL